MTHDELLKAVAKAARAEDLASDERWSARVHGTLPKEEEEDLEAAARRSDAHREAWEASQPLGSEARSRITDRLLAEIQAPKGAASTEAIARPVKRRKAPVLFAASAFLAAAAVLLFFLRSPQKPLGWDHPLDTYSVPSTSENVASPVPAYSMTLLSGSLDARSEPLDPGAVVPLNPGSKLDITLVPEANAKGPIAVRNFLIRGGQVQAWDVTAEVSEQGTARITGDTRALFKGVPAGRWVIAIAVGRPEALPTTGSDVLRALEQGEAPRQRFRLVRREVLLLDDVLRDGAGKPSGAQRPAKSTAPTSLSKPPKPGESGRSVPLLPTALPPPVIATAVPTTEPRGLRPDTFTGQPRPPRPKSPKP